MLSVIKQQFEHIDARGGGCWNGQLTVRHGIGAYQYAQRIPHAQRAARVGLNFYRSGWLRRDGIDVYVSVNQWIGCYKARECAYAIIGTGQKNTVFGLNIEPFG